MASSSCSCPPASLDVAKGLTTLQAADAIMQDGVGDHIREIQNAGGDTTKLPEVLAQSFQGYHHKMLLLARWISKIATSSSSSPSPSPESLIRNLIQQAMITAFDATKADKMLTQFTSEPEWLRKFIEVPEWREAVYKLVDHERGEGSTLLSVILQTMEGGSETWKQEVTDKNSRHKYLFFFFKSLKTELEKFFSFLDKDAALASKAEEEICKVCTYSEYTYVYAQAVLHRLMQTRPRERLQLRRLSQALTEAASDHSSSIERLDLRFSPLGRYPEICNIVGNIVKVTGEVNVLPSDVVKLCDCLDILLSRPYANVSEFQKSPAIGPKPDPTIVSALPRQNRGRSTVDERSQLAGEESRYSASNASDREADGVQRDEISEINKRPEVGLDENCQAENRELSDLEKSQAGDTETASDLGSWGDEDEIAGGPRTEVASETGSWAQDAILARLQNAEHADDKGTECASDVGSWADNMSGSPRVYVSVAPSAVDSAGNIVAPRTCNHADKVDDVDKSHVSKKKRKSLKARSTTSQSGAEVSEINCKTEKTESIFKMKAVSSAGASAPRPLLSRSSERCAEAAKSEREARRGLIEALRRPKILDALLVQLIDPSVNLSTVERERLTRLLALLTTGIEDDLLGSARSIESPKGTNDAHSQVLSPPPLPEASLQATAQELHLVYDVVHHSQHSWLRRIDALSKLNTTSIGSMAGLRWLSRSLFSSHVARSQVLLLVAQAPVFVMLRRALDQHPHQAAPIFGLLQKVLDFSQTRSVREEEDSDHEGLDGLEKHVEIDETQSCEKIALFSSSMLVYLVTLPAYNHALPVLEFAYQRAHLWDGMITRHFAIDLLESIKPPYSKSFVWAMVRWLELPAVVSAVAPSPTARGAALVLQFCNDCLPLVASECAMLQRNAEIEAAVRSIKVQLGSSSECQVTSYLVAEQSVLDASYEYDMTAIGKEMFSKKSRSKKSNAASRKRLLTSATITAEPRRQKRLKKTTRHSSSSSDQNDVQPGKENKILRRKGKILSSDDEEEFQPGCFDKHSIVQKQHATRSAARRTFRSTTARPASDAEASLSDGDNMYDDYEEDENVDGGKEGTCVTTDTMMEAAMGITAGPNAETNDSSTGRSATKFLSLKNAKKHRKDGHALKPGAPGSFVENFSVTMPSPEVVPPVSAQQHALDGAPPTATGTQQQTGGRALRMLRPRARSGIEMTPKSI